MDKNIKYEEIKIIGELMKCDKWIYLEKANEEYDINKKRRLLKNFKLTKKLKI